MTNRSASQLSNGSQSEEDWDRSMTVHESDTPRNSVAFPADAGGEAEEKGTPRLGAKRTLSELLRLHAANGEGTFSPEEANRVAEVLGQWINSSSSPYEGEDDFFTRGHSQDDSSIMRRSASPADPMGRPRGQSASAAGQP